MSSSTRDLLLKKASKVRAKKRLGQNFLIEPSVLTKIVESLNLRNDDLVVEIGPGLGFLTQELLKTGARVFAIELDREMVEQLQEIKQPNLTVIHADFLDFDISSIAPAAVAAGAKIKIVGNVPYQITTPIITHVFGEIGEPQAWLSSVESLTMTIQREVALRLSAMPGSKTYGQLTLLGNYYSVCKMIMSVGKELFVPQPDNSRGIQILTISDETIAAVGIPSQATVLGSATHPYSGQSVTVYRLPSGEFQLNTAYADGKPYIFVWSADASVRYYLAK